MLPSSVWMPLVPLLENVLSHRSPAAADLLNRLRQRSSSSNGPSQFASAPGGGQGHMQGQLLGGRAQPQQGHSPRLGGAVVAGPCPPDQEEFDWLPAHVGLQNTNNTCYMNSFIQGLFMTNHFIHRIYTFKLRLKKNPSVIDREDFELGYKIVELMQRQIARMSVTKHKHTDIWEMLQGLPPDYRSGEQQDVTETIRFVFDKLGSFEQPLIREAFAGELTEKMQCQVCKNIKSRPETFSDIVLSVPKDSEVKASGQIPTMQVLLDQRLKFELMEETEPVHCDKCDKKQRTGKWCEIVSPPAHLCVCLNRFSFDISTYSMIKEKTPVKVDGTVQIGPFTYQLYFVIIHTGKDATSGHYYAMGQRSEEGPGQGEWQIMDDSQIKPADMSLLTGIQSEKLKDDNPYVLFYRCTQAPQTPLLRMPKVLCKEMRKEQEARQES